ncbi:hypothetical protein HYH03_008084 [Edaphochlamys debaryana]|uniref:ER membrane protein complex subunit 10 n=1 Tax=Edaphochlamys debaryana TaxID=47281 RepID=A0A835Y399_9CHLO|nr:hypothetical protein HYH03_008084 [Edaphochlamys debaryana]|eukprot:KAG2493868.1 hypothetical protein HYH03_008084 [Edaphochlamys debaryana]
MGHRSLALVLLALSFAGHARGAALTVEHSFGNGPFLPAGKLVGDVKDVVMTWEREESLSSAEEELLEKAIKEDGLYLLRVQTPRGTLLSSVRAACLKAPGFKEQAEVQADRSGALLAFSYSVPACSPAHAHGDGEGAEAAPAASSAPAPRSGALPVRVLLPFAGPLLVAPDAAGDFVDVSMDAPDPSLAGAGAGSGAAYDPSAKPRAAAQAGGAAQRKGGPPPPDERTWLQKNWMFVVAGALMVFNVIAKANAPPPPGGAPAAGGGGGGGGGGGAVARR